MARRSTFPLRLDPKTLSALRAWADDELRSLNGQIEYLLRHALRDAGRLSAPPSRPTRQRPGRADNTPPTRESRTGAGKPAIPRAHDRRELAVETRE